MDEQRYDSIVAAFDEIAADGAHVSGPRRGYHELVTALYQSIVPPGASVLELGSGSGDLLAALEPRARRRRRRQHRHGRARPRASPGAPVRGRAPARTSSSDETFDYVVLSDLVPYVDDLLGPVQTVARQSTARPGS